MTQEEYEKICELINENKVEDWTTFANCRMILTPYSISNLKRQIKKLVKE